MNEGVQQNVATAHTAVVYFLFVQPTRCCATQVNPCDMRRAVSEAKLQFPGVDFSLIESDTDIRWKADARESRKEMQVCLQSPPPIIYHTHTHILAFNGVAALCYELGGLRLLLCPDAYRALCPVLHSNVISL